MLNSLSIIKTLSLIGLPLLSMTVVQASVNNTDDSDSQYHAIVHSIDYVSVDYPGAVIDGKVVNAAEYAEQLEITQHALTQTQNLPENPQKMALLSLATALNNGVREKKSAIEITQLCRDATVLLLSAYQVRIAPKTLPSLTQGQQLYAENCVMCHGLQGFGDGVQAAALMPKPANFHDVSRQQHRSVYGLFNTISLGVADTAMSSFAQFSQEQRWALAFYVSNFYADSAEVTYGKQLWTDGKLKAVFTSIDSLTQAKPAELAQQYGAEGLAVLAYLRAEPQLIQQKMRPPLDTARHYLSLSLPLYLSGNTKDSYAMALAAYLEGFELIESTLKTTANELRTDIEHDMAAYRNMIKVGADPSAVEQKQQAVLLLLDKAEAELSGSVASASMNFITSMVILLREGLEAILVLAAIVSMLIKSNRRDAIRYIHAGWVAALLLGLVTWYVAAHFLVVSGASREITEGVVALLAAGMLFYVGFWLHNQTHSVQWQQFVRTKINASLSKGALWGLAFVAFMAVYREVFESVLFYQSLLLNNQPSAQSAIMAGIVVAAALLVLLAWVIMRYSVRLPLRLFFGVNMGLMFLLAVVFAGKGVAALQEAGIFPINPITFPQIDMLGIYPNLESLGLQIVLIGLALAWISYGYVRGNKVKGGN